MIEQRQEVLHLFDEYLIAERERICQYWAPEAAQWSAKKYNMYVNGAVLGKFRERDPMTMDTLEEGVSDTALQEELRLHLELEIKARTGLVNLDKMQKLMLQAYQNQYDQLLSQSVDDWINCHLGEMLTAAEGLSYSKTRVLIYLHYAFFNYDSIRRNRYNSDLSCLTTYARLFDKQSQFKSYGLVPIDQHRMIIPIAPPRIYDSSINKTLLTKNIPLHLLEKLSDMKTNGVITDLAVRLMNEPGYEGRRCSEYIQEALERGEQFVLANLGTFSVSRLYSDSYDDCLWVVIDPQNITFEELCEDYEFENDMIITQVVHLEYITSEDGAFITHLDHEYIFYTFEQYDERLHNPSQKGEAKTRIKSFKIDNSRIPFDHTCENKRKDENGNDLPVQHVPFLIYVLESYFKHKDLLFEYFQKLYQQSNQHNSDS